MREGKLTTFQLRVDGGETLTFQARHSEYKLALMEAFGKLDLPYPCDVEMWVDDLLPDYGPYHYRIAEFQLGGYRYGCPAILTLHKPAALEAQDAQA